jgi:hypothetical protein
MRSHVVVDLPDLSTIINWQRDTPTHRYGSHLKSRIVTCIYCSSTLCPSLTAPESFYGTPIHNPCLALTRDSAIIINHTCLAVDVRNSCTIPRYHPLDQSALLSNTTTSTIHHCTECVHLSLYITRLGSTASSTSNIPGPSLPNIPCIKRTVLPHHPN